MIVEAIPPPLIFVSEYHGSNMGPNIALRKPAKQSSTANSTYLASNAVDGASYTHPARCTRTKLALGNWWRVELGAVYLIRQVVVTNQGDPGECPL